MLLQELFKKTVNYRVVKNTSSTFSTRATIGGRDIVFVAGVEHEGASGGVELDVEFGEVKMKAGMEVLTYDITNKGHALEVFSMVIDSLREAIMIYQPDIINFTAEKEGDSNSDLKRADLYEKIAKRFKEFEVTTKDVGRAVMFKLYRK